MAIVTFEAVSAAAAALEAAGEKSTVRKVMNQLLITTGVKGSTNTVTKLFHDYKSGRPLVRATDVGLDAGITQAIASQMQRVAELAASSAEERANDLDDNLKLMMDSQTEAERKIEILDAELAMMKAQATEAEGKLTGAVQGAARSQEQSAKILMDLRQELASEREKSERVIGELARAEVRLEALPPLVEQSDRLQESVEEIRRDRNTLAQSAATLAAQLDASEGRVHEFSERIKILEKRVERADEKVEKLQEIHSNARMQLVLTKMTLHEAQAKTKTNAGQISALLAQIEDMRAASADHDRPIAL
jgi:chromosome segregation ATPase